MRLLRFFLLSLGLLALVGGFGAGSALAASKDTGFYVFKDMRSSAVTEFRDAHGKLVWSEVSIGEKGAPGTACGDSHHTMVGARWGSFPAYFVNVSSIPDEINALAALDDLQAAHEGWEDPWTTDCSNIPGPSPYVSIYGGESALGASLAELQLDGANVVEFRSLQGTVCGAPGVVACVVAWSESGRFVEADMALEADLTRLGGNYHWTTGDRTSFESNRGKFAVSDVATHEFGHFAGLGHVKTSPALTMFPAIHDGMQTLGLGDMKGLLTRY
jgi:hypothetical protein